MSNQTDTSHSFAECGIDFCGRLPAPNTGLRHYPVPDSVFDGANDARDVATANSGSGVRISASGVQFYGGITAAPPRETLYVEKGRPCLVAYDGRHSLLLPDDQPPMDITLPPVSKAVLVARLRALADLIENS